MTKFFKLVNGNNFLEKGSLVLIAIILFIAIKVNRVIFTADAQDYFLIEQAMVNHFSPDIRTKDIDDAWEQLQPYFNMPEDSFIQKHIRPFVDEKNPEESSSWGFFRDKTGDVYPYHFWFYSLLCLPISLLLNFCGFNLIYAFPLTHLVLILALSYYLLFKSRFNLWLRYSALILFLFSPSLWYTEWIHTETFTCIFIYWALFLYFDKRYYSALLLSSLSAIQNPTLIAFAGFLFLETIFNKPFKIRNLIKTFLCSIWVFSSYLFYYLKFGKISLITDNYMDIGNINWRRFIGFFFDLDQGMIYGVPLILPLFIILFPVYLYKAVKNKKLQSHYFLPFVLLITIIGLMPMTNWSSAYSIVYRYAAWCAMILIGYLFFLIQKRNYAKIVIPILLLSQIFTTLFHGGVNPPHLFYSHRQTPLKLMKKYPDYYNPDYYIFLVRHGYVKYPGKVVPLTPYLDYPKKILVTSETIDQIKQFGYSKNEIESISKKVDYYNGYGYVNVPPKNPSLLHNKKHDLLFVNGDFCLFDPKKETYLTNNNMFPLKGKILPIDEKGIQNDKIIILDSSKPFSPGWEIPIIKKNTKITLVAWVKGDITNAKLVAQGNDYYGIGNQENQEKDGWTQIVFSDIIKKNIDNVKIYLWYPENKSLKIDNMSIYLKKEI
ncbi:MAG: hypothetical protein ACEPOW_10310 [Bacteroidales bacterium]